MSFIFNTSFKRSISEQEKYSDTFLPETPDNQLKTENIGINRTSELAGWSSGRELAELKSSLETIRATAAEIINTIDGHFAELQKEREAAKAQEAEKEPTPDLAAEPTVTILWSESPQLREGDTFPLSRANALIEAIDEANLASPGYDKTEFRIDYVMNGIPDHYEGRQDLGDGEGALIEHIEKYHTYYANDPNWENFLLQHEGKEALEADKEHRAMLLNEFIPYLKLHCNLSEMERIAGEALQAGDNLTPTETAYHTVIQAYVAECRGLVNQGEYNLPPVPQLRDFDVELEAYKEHVKDEIAQEAADAGMTVEEAARDIWDIFNSFEQSGVSEGLLNDFEKVKNKVVFSLVNYGMNKERLESMPYVPYLDLAILFYVLLDRTENGERTAVITNKELAAWGTTKEELLRLARQNTPRLYMAEVNPLNDVIKSLMKDTKAEDFIDEWIRGEESSFYVLSNRHNVKGAAVILYDGLLKEMSKVLGHDLLILPSSVHEVLVMAYDKTMDLFPVRDMVEHINKEEVPVCDVLSDQIYRYNREKDQVSFLIEDMES